MYEMTFYCAKQPDGTIHVQNAVMGHLGQHHVHTGEDFQDWTRTVDPRQIVWLKAKPCDCGLKAGGHRTREQTQ